jgi:hypothetical protein
MLQPLLREIRYYWLLFRKWRFHGDLLRSSVVAALQFEK